MIKIGLISLRLKVAKSSRPWFGSRAPPLERTIPGHGSEGVARASALFSHPLVPQGCNITMRWRLLRLSLTSGGIRTLSPSSFVCSMRTMTDSCGCLMFSFYTTFLQFSTQCLYVRSRSLFQVTIFPSLA